MHIVCPHCTTSYAVKMAALGVAGRTVRCSRCKETWLARPEDVSASAEDGAPTAVKVRPMATTIAAEPQPASMVQTAERDVPVVDSPSIAGGFPDSFDGPDAANDPSASGPELSGAQWTEMPSDAAAAKHPAARGSWFKRRPAARKAGRRAAGKPTFGLSTTCVAMAALVAALLIWRADLVRLLPQTAGFYKAVGLEVNLRGLAFKDLKVSTDLADGKPVLVVEGVIVDVAHTSVELPKLQFVVRDAKGTQIYAWDSTLEQSTLKSGETAWFRSRLASPPAEARAIDVRFARGAGAPPASRS